MARRYVINSVTRQVYETHDTSKPPPKPNRLILYGVDDPTVANPPPLPDPLTHQHELKFTDDDVAGTRTFRKEVVAKQQTQIDDEAQSAADDAERQLLKQFWIDNLQPTLPVNPTTNAELRTLVLEMRDQFEASKRVMKYIVRGIVR